MLSVTRDITERKRAEGLLRDKERLLSEAERIAQLGSWRWNFDTREILWSDQVYRLCGVTPESYSPSAGAPPSTVHPDDKAAMHRWMSDRRAGRPGGDLALRVIRPDGSVRFLLSRGDLLLTADGRVIGMLGTIQDITERRKAELALREAAVRYRTLFDANPHPMWVIDPQTLRYLAVNDAAVAHYGYSREEFLAMSLLDIRPAEDVPALHLGLQRQKYLEPSSPSRHRRKDGQVIDVEVTTQPLDFEGRPARVALAHDVTEQRRASRLLLESRESLRALLQRLQHAQEEERTRVAREVHDELGQLLTGVKMDLRWLERRLSEPGLPPALQGLLDRTVAASDLNEQTIGAVQRLAAKLRPGALDQLGLAAALAQRARQFQQQTEISCSLSVTEPLPPLPQAVGLELFYICQEALTNVTRHAQASRVTIRLRAEGGGVHLEVEDDGIGIDPAQQAKPHSLGLLGMHERARHCNGTVRLGAADGRGTRLVVQLPLPAPAASAAAAGAAG